MAEQPQEIQPTKEPEKGRMLVEALSQAQPRKTRPRFMIIGGAALLVIVLAGAAFLAGTLMNRLPSSQNGSAGGPQANNGGKVQVESISKSEVTPAAELPTIQADIHGIFLSRSGNTFTIGTGSTVGLTTGADGTPQPHYNGPAYEVVVAKNTLVYKDTTTIDPGYSGPIQQTVAPGTLDDLNTITMVSVWGKKTGDRYVADIIVYMQPMTSVSGGSGGTLK